MNSPMRIGFRTAFGILLLVPALTSAPSADVIVKMKESTDLDHKKPKVSTGSMMIGADRLAIRWDDPSEQGHGGFIFRADKELVWVVDDQKKSYQQIDKAIVDEVAAEAATMMAQMRAKIAELPPDQRAQAEEMMKKYGGGLQEVATALKPDYRRTGETRVIGGHTCTKVDTYRGEDLISHAWVAPYSDWNLTLNDAAVFEKMNDFVSKMTGQMANMEKKDHIPMHELNGVPLMTQELEGGKVTRETVLESVTRGSSPSGAFEVPAGYKLQPFPHGEHKK